MLFRSVHYLSSGDFASGNTSILEGCRPVSFSLDNSQNTYYVLSQYKHTSSSASVSNHPDKIYTQIIKANTDGTIQWAKRIRPSQNASVMTSLKYAWVKARNIANLTSSTWTTDGTYYGPGYNFIGKTIIASNGRFVLSGSITDVQYILWTPATTGTFAQASDVSFTVRTSPFIVSCNGDLGSISSNIVAEFANVKNYGTNLLNGTTMLVNGNTTFNLVMDVASTFSTSTNPPTVNTIMNVSTDTSDGITTANLGSYTIENSYAQNTTMRSF